MCGSVARDGVIAIHFGEDGGRVIVNARDQLFPGRALKLRIRQQAGLEGCGGSRMLAPVVFFADGIVVKVHILSIADCLLGLVEPFRRRIKRR